MTRTPSKERNATNALWGPSGEAQAGERLREALGPGVVGVGAHVFAPRLAHAGAQPPVLGEPSERPSQRDAVSGGSDHAVAPVTHQAAGGGPDGVACDHGQSAVHGLVYHEPPWLAEGLRRNRWQHQNLSLIHISEPTRLG